VRFSRRATPSHPAAPGENLTIAGVDWPAYVPGVELAIGACGC
jgi:hypothetical protein